MMPMPLGPTSPPTGPNRSQSVARVRPPPIPASAPTK